MSFNYPKKTTYFDNRGNLESTDCWIDLKKYTPREKAVYRIVHVAETIGVYGLGIIMVLLLPVILIASLLSNLLLDK